MSDLQNVLNQWTPRIDEVGAQQEGKLDEVLLRFEQAAMDGAHEAFESSVASVRLVSAFGYLMVHYLSKPLGRMEEVIFWAQVEMRKAL